MRNEESTEERDARNAESANHVAQRDPQQLQTRTKAFALRVVRLSVALPKTLEAQTIGRQLLRSGTGVGANYRAACRANSQADFVSKMHIVEEEVDESSYWMELLAEAGLVRRQRLSALLQEGDQLLAIAVASTNTVRGGRRAGRAPARALGGHESAI